MKWELSDREEAALLSVLSQAGFGTPWVDTYGRPTLELPSIKGVAAFAYLHPVEGGSAIELSIYPADTLTQARAFYASEAKLAGLRQLTRSGGWTAKPNFHFGHLQRGLAFCTTSIDVASYMSLWSEEIATTTSVNRADWDTYWTWLLGKGIVSPADREEFDRAFTRTKRKSASVRPGLAVSRRWQTEPGRVDVAPDALRSALRAAVQALDVPPRGPS
jgi:hypothetical protein